MRVLFAGSPPFAIPSFDAVADHHNVVSVLTNPDRASGRGRTAVPTAVKQRALARGVPVVQPHRLNREARTEIAIYDPEILVVVAFSRIFGPKFLGLFPRGGVNVHPSLLPAYRGPAPIPAAIVNGEERTGVTIQEISVQMDAGDVLKQREIPIGPATRAPDLSERAASVGAELLVEALADIERGTARPVPQDHSKATYCSIIEKEDGRVNWNRPAADIERMIRAYDPWPGTHTFYRGKRLNLLEASVRPDGDDRSALPGTVLGVDNGCGILIQTRDGVLCVNRLQLQAKKPLDWKTFLNGVREFVGSVLGEG
jgi:methionyl-tRNA formyltransferase